MMKRRHFDYEKKSIYYTRYAVNDFWFYLCIVSIFENQNANMDLNYKKNREIGK